MNLFVAGGAGFIGAAFTRLLVAAGHRVTILDDGSGADLRQVPVGARLLRADVRSVHARMLDGIDCVVNLAGSPSVADAWRQPEHTFSVQAHGTRALLDAAAGAGVARFVFVSSAAVSAGVPSPYAEAKRAAERLVDAASGRFCKGALSVRPFNVYGPGQRLVQGEGPVIQAFLDAIRHGRPLPIRSRTAERDFIHLHDVARALVRAACASAAAGTLDLGTGRATSILALASQMSELAGVPLRVTDMPLRGPEAARSVADTSALVRVFGIDCVPLEVGLPPLLRASFERVERLDAFERRDAAP